MNVMGQPHFGNQGNLASGNASAIRLLGGDREMRRLDRYFASKNFSRMMPFVSMKKNPGRAMPLNCPTASVFKT
jgi:hypothetical protein